MCWISFWRLAMKIMSINVNCFGGTTEHREEYKKIYGSNSYKREWDKLDKDNNVSGIFDFVIQHSPDIVVFQEYDINSKEAQCFTEKMEKEGFSLNSETPKPKSRPSMTVMFIKENIKFNTISGIHDRNGKAYAIKAGNIIIYGTHIPPKPFDENFWKELHRFVESVKTEHYILIGDFNTINYKNKNELENLIRNNDSWKIEGSPLPSSNPPVSLDYAILSPKIKREDIETLSSSEEISKFTDHPFILVMLKC